MKPYTQMVMWGAIIQVVVYATLLFWGKEAVVAAIISLILAVYYVGRDQYRIRLGAALVCMMAAPSLFFMLAPPGNTLIASALTLYALWAFVATARELHRKPLTAVAVVIIAITMQCFAIQTANDFLLRPLMALTAEELLRAVLEGTILSFSCALLWIGWVLVENHQRVKQARGSIV